MPLVENYLYNAHLLIALLIFRGVFAWPLAFRLTPLLVDSTASSVVVDDVGLLSCEAGSGGLCVAGGSAEALGRSILGCCVSLAMDVSQGSLM